MGGHAKEVASGRRFEFGKNWAAFLERLGEEQIREAEQSFVEMLGIRDLSEMSFLDIGSGSGLSSLVARRLGARVYSFDYDPESVACTLEIKRRCLPDDQDWQVHEGSILDEEYLATLGEFDIVYSWGVLHHTGHLWKSVESAVRLASSNGLLFLALYNDQGRASRRWTTVKRLYCRLPRFLKWLVLYPCVLRLWGPTMVRDFLRLRPLKTWNDYHQGRGMSPWRDVVDWVGGYPFEVSRPEQVLRKVQAHGFILKNLRTCAGGHGCNEYVFQRSADRFAGSETSVS